MEDLQEPTVVLTALKDWNMLLGGPRVSSGARGGAGGRRLDFNLSRKGSSPASPVSVPSPAPPDLPRGQKRNLDSLVGFGEWPELFCVTEGLTCGHVGLE